MVNLNKVIIPSGLKLSEDIRLIEMGNLLGLKIYSNQLGGRVFIRNKKINISSSQIRKKLF